jgi:hypothetical protein
MIRNACPTLGTALVLLAFALTLVGDTSAAFDSQESGGAEHRKRRRKHDSDIVRGHGFVLDNGEFNTIDAPGAGLFTITFGVDDGGRTVGGYVDRKGTLHGFLFDKCDFNVIDFPGAKATFAARINNRGQIVGAYSEESNTPVFSLPHGFLLDDGVFTTIDFPGSAASNIARGINDRGQIVGTFFDAQELYSGFRTTVFRPEPNAVYGRAGRGYSGTRGVLRKRNREPVLQC